MKEQELNYYDQPTSQIDNFKDRVAGDDVVNDLLDELVCIERDQYGRITKTDWENAIVNKQGHRKILMLFKSGLSKFTTLTKYDSHEQLNRQFRPWAENTAFTIALHMDEWEIKDPDLLQQVIEKVTYEAALRAHKGFENKNVSTSTLHHITESRSQTDKRPAEYPIEQPKKSWWKRG